MVELSRSRGLELTATDLVDESDRELALGLGIAVGAGALFGQGWNAVAALGAEIELALD